MIRFLTDEDFKSAILVGVRLRLPDLDIVRVQDCGLRSFRDPLILEFAAAEDRIVLSHDVNTMGTHARRRLLAGKRMPGLFLITLPSYSLNVTFSPSKPDEHSPKKETQNGISA